MRIVPLESGVQNRQTHNCNYTVSRQKIKQVVLFYCDLKNWEIWEQFVSKRSYRKYRERNNHEKAFSPLKDQISSNKLSLIVSTQTCEKRKWKSRHTFTHAVWLKPDSLQLWRYSYNPDPTLYLVRSVHQTSYLAINAVSKWYESTAFCCFNSHLCNRFRIRPAGLKPDMLLDARGSQLKRQQMQPGEHLLEGVCKYRERLANKSDWCTWNRVFRVNLENRMQKVWRYNIMMFSNRQSFVQSGFVFKPVSNAGW